MRETEVRRTQGKVPGVQVRSGKRASVTLNEAPEGSYLNLMLCLCKMDIQSVLSIGLKGSNKKMG